MKAGSGVEKVKEKAKRAVDKIKDALTDNRPRGQVMRVGRQKKGRDGRIAQPAIQVRSRCLSLCDVVGLAQL